MADGAAIGRAGGGVPWKPPLRLLSMEMSSVRSGLAQRHLRAVTSGAAASEPAPRDSSAQALVEPSDDVLIDAILTGDDRVAAQLYRRLDRAIDRALYRVIGARGRDHDDLVQATFETLVVTVQRGSFHRDCSLETWATAIATRLALNALRSRRRERSAFDAIESYEQRRRLDCRLESELDARAEIERLRLELSRMKPTRAEAVYLHDVLGHPLADVARLCGTSIAAAQSRLVRGRRELYQKMGWPLEGKP